MATFSEQLRVVNIIFWKKQTKQTKKMKNFKLKLSFVMQLWMMQKKKNVLSKLDTRLDATETGKAAEERSSSV